MNPRRALAAAESAFGRPLPPRVRAAVEAAARTVARICSVDGCDRLEVADGLCSRHYSQRRRGLAAPVSEPAVDRRCGTCGAQLPQRALRRVGAKCPACVRRAAYRRAAEKAGRNDRGQPGTCRQCGGPLELRGSGSGRQPEFCSQQCRRDRAEALRRAAYRRRKEAGRDLERAAQAAENYPE